MVTKRIRIPVGYEKTEVWTIPKGFEQEYLQRAAIPIKASLWCEILTFVGIKVTEDMFRQLTHRQRVEAEVYASMKHAGREYPKPQWL